MSEKERAANGGLRFFNWEWQSAEEELRRGVELNPNLAFAHQYYGEGGAWKI